MPRENQWPAIKFLLEVGYDFDCECLVCTNPKRSALISKIEFSANPLFKEAVQPLLMTVQEFRQLSRCQIGNYEKKAIEFLEKYNEFHPIFDTACMQANLRIMWSVLASRV